MSTAEMFWKAANEIRSPCPRTHAQAVTELVKMAFGPDGPIQKRATDILRGNRIAVARLPQRHTEKMA